MIPNLSTIIITRNEEHDIEDCLQSVADMCSDIVVVDSGSTDRTVEIARKYTDRIYQREWDGFGPQKQFALDMAKGPWVLNIDADECVTLELATEITHLLAKSPEKTGYRIPFRHYFLGRELKFGGMRGETHLRLFRKDKATYGKARIHEGISVPGSHGHLKSPIDHYSYKDLDEYMQKCNRYTSLIAEEKYRNGARFHLWHHLRLPWEFFVRYVLKLGFLDGSLGLTYALLSSYYVWMKFVKLQDLEPGE